MTLLDTEQAAAGLRTGFTATFPCHAYAVQFLEAMAGNTQVTSTRLNRRNGRVVSFEAPAGSRGDLARIIGDIGSTPGDADGSHTAYLDEEACAPPDGCLRR
jgi:hypothetical protein